MIILAERENAMAAVIVVVVGERKLGWEVIPYRKVKSGAGGRLTKVVSQSKKGDENSGFGRTEMGHTAEFNDGTRCLA